MSSRGVNKVIILGNIGQDPEVKYSQGGTAFCSITVATSEEWIDKQSREKKSKVEWHRVVLSGKLAEIAGEYVKKGSQVYFEGKLQTRKWQDQSGQDKYTTEVVVDPFGGVMQLLGGKPQGQQAQQGHPAQQPQGGYSAAKGGHQQSRQAPPPAYNEPPMDFSDEIPF